MSNNLVPLLRYECTPDCDTNNENEWWHRDIRYWSVFQYTDGKAIRTVEAGFIFNYARDFCGGMYFSSPQVYEHAQSSWTQRFVSHAHGDIDASWDRLEREPNLLPSINEILGKERVSSNEADDWAKQCLAATVIGSAMSCTKRGIMAADTSGGLCREIMGMMASMRGMIPVPPQARGWSMQDMQDGRDPCKAWVGNYGYHLDGAELYESGEFRNFNSGSQVVMMSLILDFDHDADDTACPECEWGHIYDGRCDDCGYEPESSDNTYRLPKCVAEAYANPEYLKLLRMGTWSNG